MANDAFNGELVLIIFNKFFIKQKQILEFVFFGLGNAKDGVNGQVNAFC